MRFQVLAPVEPRALLETRCCKRRKDPMGPTSHYGTRKAYRSPEETGERISKIAPMGSVQAARHTRLWRRYAAISKLGIRRCIALKRRDADLKGYLDSIPRDKRMACVRMRVVDRSVLTLIRMWLEVPVVEPGGSGGEPAKGSRSQKGTPQGGVSTP